MFSSDEKLEELYTKFIVKVDAEWKSFLKETREEITNLQRKKQKLLEEQNILSKVVKDADEILSLSISGEKIMVKRSVLTMVHGSTLELLISNDAKLQKDKDGSIYLDFNPICFKKIVDFLKLKALESKEKPAPVPNVDSTIKEEFEFLAEYLGLLHLFQVGKNKEEKKMDEPIDNKKKEEVMNNINDCFDKKDSDVEISENGTVCTKINGDGHRYAFGRNIYSQGINKLEFKVEQLSSHWLFLGILDNTLDQDYSNHNSFKWKGCYGWTAGNGGQILMDTKISYKLDGYDFEKNDFLQGDTIVLTLNLQENQNTLTFHNKRNNKSYVLPIPPKKSWKLHVNLNYNGDRLRLASNN